MVKLWLIILAVAFEAAGVSTLFANYAAAYRLPGYLLGHAIASLLFSVVLWQFMPQRYRYPITRAAVFLFIIQFFIPFIGSIGLSTGLMLALRLPRKRRPNLWYEIDTPDLPYRPSEVSSQPLYSQGGLSQVLYEASSVEKRIRAVMATKQMNNRDSVTILQQALKDTSDDVRLLAYAMLDEKEKKITDQIKDAQHAFARAEAEHRQQDGIAQQILLAGHYWEMAYLGLAQGGVKNHFLSLAVKSCLLVLAHTRDAGILRLLGRIYIETEQITAAEDAFLEAIEQGLPRPQLLPYLAEIAWLQRNFRKVHALITELSTTPQPVHQNFYGVLQYWL